MRTPKNETGPDLRRRLIRAGGTNEEVPRSNQSDEEENQTGGQGRRGWKQEWSGAPGTEHQGRSGHSDEGYRWRTEREHHVMLASLQEKLCYFDESFSSPVILSKAPKGSCAVHSSSVSTFRVRKYGGDQSVTRY